MSKPGQAIAIDIGTSKIAICINNNGRIQQLEINPTGGEYPCAVYYNNKIFFGSDAINKAKKNGKYLFTNLKCLIGRKYSEPYIQDIAKTATFTIAAGENDRVMVEVCENNKPVLKDPTELLSLLVNHAIELAKQHLDNKDIQYLALAFPPSYNDLQKQELMRIAVNTGIRHIEFYPETTAASFYYGFSMMAPGQVLKIIDCGAGTCDVSLLKYENNEFQIIVHDGFDNIGGNQFTDALKSFVYSEFMKINCDCKSLKRAQVNELNQSIENAKILLRTQSTVDIEIDVEGISPVTVSQKRLDIVSRDLNKRVKEKIQQLLRSNPENAPNFLLFSGKGMKLRCLAEEVSKTVGLKEQAMNIDEPVAHGLAMRLPDIIKNHPDSDNCNIMNNFANAEEDVTLDTLNQSFPMPEGFDLPPIESNPPVIQPMSIEPPIILPAPIEPPVIPPISIEPYVNISIDTDFPIIPPISIDPSNSNPFISSMPIAPSDPIPENDIMPIDSIVDIRNIPEPPSDLDMTPSTFNPDSIPCNLPLTNTIDDIKEKRAQNISIGAIKRPDGSNIIVLYDRKTPLPVTVERTVSILKGKAFEFFLYEGNEMTKKKCKRIRHTILQRDENHPDTSKHHFIIKMDIAKDGSIKLDFRWEDNQEPIKVIKDEEVRNTISRPKPIKRQSNKPVYDQPQFIRLADCLIEINRIIDSIKEKYPRMNPMDTERIDGAVKNAIRKMEQASTLKDGLDVLKIVKQIEEDANKVAGKPIELHVEDREEREDDHEDGPIPVMEM